MKRNKLHCCQTEKDTNNTYHPSLERKNTNGRTNSTKGRKTTDMNAKSLNAKLPTSLAVAQGDCKDGEYNNHYLDAALKKL
mmetsp:Transcript_11241/g.25075  ORF Transcript_11241/g.25075 Transcript_11241/m.25075 type:complete len:81 (-) Transcript_11241:23-265(-)